MKTKDNPQKEKICSFFGHRNMVATPELREKLIKTIFCVFYYDSEYKPPMRKYSKHDLTNYQPTSGTKLAYEYAEKKGVEIINLVNEKE